MVTMSSPPPRRTEASQLNLEEITPQLTKEMAPLSLFSAFVMCALVPWLFFQSLSISAQREAQFISNSVADGLQRQISRDPLLWAYRPQELYQLIHPYEELGAVVNCSLPDQRVCYSTHLPNPLPAMVTASSPLLKHGHLIGQVQVQMPTEISSLWLSVTWLALPIGLVISLLIFLLPRGAARRLDRTNLQLWRELKSLNQTLETRVQERTEALELSNLKLLNIQEEERARMSRDLHDELGQTLTGLRLHLTALQFQNTAQDELNHSLQDALNIVDLGVDQVRRIAYEQRPPELDLLGLHDALHSLGRRAELRSGMKINISCGQLPPLSEEQMIALFRLAQEGLTNAMRHSGGQQIMIKISASDAELCLSIHDDGTGPPQDVIWGGGLIGAYGRARRVGGQFSFGAHSDGGSELKMRIPLG